MRYRRHWDREPCSVNWTLGEVMCRADTSRNESHPHRATKRAIGNAILQSCRGKRPVVADLDYSGNHQVFEIQTDGMRPIVECGYPQVGPVENASDFYAEHGFYPDAIFDVGLVRGAKVIGAIEVVHANPPSATKLALLKSAGIFVILVRSFHSDHAPLVSRLPEICAYHVYPNGSRFLVPTRSYQQ